MLRFQNYISDRVQDFRYTDAQSITLPASTIFIGTQGRLDDATPYTAGDLIFSFANGAGNNGLDVGVEAQDQWYALYAVPLTGSGYMLKASVNPPHSAGGSGPTGFSRYRYLGVFRNGGNGYDTTAGYGRGDIARFEKRGQYMWFKHFNSNSGGSRIGNITQGICVESYSTTINDTMFGNTASNIGFAGRSPTTSGAKLPYANCAYYFQGWINSTAAASMQFRDTGGNDRLWTGFSLVFNSTPQKSEVWYTFSQDPSGAITDSVFIVFSIVGNPSVARALTCGAMIDHYII